MALEDMREKSKKTLMFNKLNAKFAEEYDCVKN